MTVPDHAAPAQHTAYHELLAYTVTRGDTEFIHQYVVDAWAAQTAGAESKPIGVFFALVGLYLHVEHAYTGRAVQRVHMRLAQRVEPWPLGPLPTARGTITACDVLAQPPGGARDQMIRRWAADVWTAYDDQRDAVAMLLRRRRIIP